MLSVVIPVYKNVDMFLSHMRHNISWLEPYEIIIVNDDPRTSMKSVMKEFSTIRLIENERNLGFGGAVNRGMQEATHDYCMWLNSDVRLLDDSFLRALQQCKKDTTLFAVSFAQREKDKSIVGKNCWHWHRGFLHHSKADTMRSGITAWAEAGACIVDREKFNDLGCFDSLYTPFYWEDIDLSYRAWKRGYRVEFNRDVLVEHHHESTIGKYFPKQKTVIALRNHYLFVWTNITDPFLMSTHVMWIIPQTIYAIRTYGVIITVQSIGGALMRIPRITYRRFRKRGSTARPDNVIISICTHKTFV